MVERDLPVVRGGKLPREALPWLREIERFFPGTTKDIILVRNTKETYVKPSSKTRAQIRAHVRRRGNQDGHKVCLHLDQTQHGLIKFHEKGEPPTRHMGPMFGGYVPPARTDLGDTDKSLWPKGLNGEPVDPWKSQVLLPLKELDGDRLYIFQTMSLTGLRAVASLISECRQMAKRDPDNYPVIELAVGAFEHRNPQIGTVKKPSFKIVGKASRDGIAAPQISTGAVLDDEIPF